MTTTGSRHGLSLALLLLAACAGPARSPSPPVAAGPTAALAPAPHSTMLVHFIDVGQGAATLFEFADGAVLVDTGGEENAVVNSDDRLSEYLTSFFERR